VVFELDPRLQKDTFDCGRFELCRVLLMNDSHYVWFILVPQRDGVTEIHHLSAVDRAQLWQESQQLSEWLEKTFSFDKLNVGALGNVVSQLHLHHVCRKQNDPAWPGPVWGFAPAVPYPAKGLEELKQKIQQAFPELQQ
jgi:diadenosine tetraphosphate (Ap4A) HIT family hydrolase